MTISALLSVAIWLVFAGLIWWAINRIIAVIPMEEPIRTVVHVILVVVLCLIVLNALLGLLPGVHFPLLR